HKELSPEEMNQKIAINQYEKDEIEILSFKFNEFNKLKADIIICDESSMIDNRLMNHLMKAIDYDKTKVIFLGDTNQLPSIGCGNVLNDLINSKNVVTVTLDKIKRQASESGIVKNSLNAINGISLESDNHNKDFFFMNVSNENKSLELAMKSIERIQDIKKEDGLDNIQILSPTKKGACGVDNLNLEIKKRFMGHILSGPNMELKKFMIANQRKSLYLNIGDKVIQTENNYNPIEFSGFAEDGINSKFDENHLLELHKSEDLIANGEDGIVIGFIETYSFSSYESFIKTTLKSTSEEEIVSLANEKENKKNYILNYINKNQIRYVLVRFEDRVLAYQEDELIKNLDLSYAITVHKSQGSQWTSVVCVFPSYVDRMFSKNLIYTAITRAQSFCAVVGEEKAVTNGLQVDATNRDTLLRERIDLKIDYSMCDDFIFKAIQKRDESKSSNNE
ncbi:MAG: AAA family ATPase, partial [Peptostreptococcaceae bacterium]